MFVRSIVIASAALLLGACSGGVDGTTAETGDQAASAARAPLSLRAVTGENIEFRYADEYVTENSNKPTSSRSLTELKASVDGGSIAAGSVVEIRLTESTDSRMLCGMTGGERSDRIFSLKLAETDGAFSGDLFAAGILCEDGACTSGFDVAKLGTKPKTAFERYCYKSTITWHAAVRVVSPTGEERWLDDSFPHENPHDFQLMFDTSR